MLFQDQYAATMVNLDSAVDNHGSQRRHCAGADGSAGCPNQQ
jgi:hypothetical protein